MKITKNHFQADFKEIVKAYASFGKDFVKFWLLGGRFSKGVAGLTLILSSGASCPTWETSEFFSAVQVQEKTLAWIPVWGTNLYHRPSDSDQLDTPGSLTTRWMNRKRALLCPRQSCGPLLHNTFLAEHW